MKRQHLIIFSLCVFAITASISAASASDIDAQNITVMHSTVKEGFTVILQSEGTVTTSNEVYEGEYALCTDTKGNQILFIWNQTTPQPINDISTIWFILMMGAILFLFMMWFLLGDW